ncbi:hypothetical protein AAG570_003883 [Ranatra chinensis]|uniref:Uncharacterized protein n=1 Tax=Ranatra chinensis TaxID=642074 RepID=A0ABD0YGR0_9HEMI
MEIEVMDLIDESCTASFKLELAGALEKAKEASAKEKNLIRFQEETGLADSHNLDLTFLVLFNLASQYAANSMYNEALSTYSVITRNRMFHNSNHLKINMAHIYVQIGDLPKAVKTYRMALDQIPATHTDLRVKIMFNIGLLFVKMGQYNDACNSFEYIMQERPDFKPGLFAILCYFTIGDKEKMKQGFLNLLQVPLNIDEDRYDNTDESRSKFIVETLRDDSLRKLEMEMKQEAEHCILTAVNLLAPVIEPTFTAGYDWCLTALRNSTHEGLAGNLEVNRAIVHLKKGEVTTAIESLKTVEKQDPKLVSIAATNLSFVHFLLGEIDEAEKFAEQARTADGYNTAAFINLANCSIMKGDHEKAKQLYLTALESSGTSIEALYNLGLLYKREEQYEDAIECFLKLHSVISSHPPVLYQLAQLHQLVGDVDQAIEWYLQLLSVVPADPSILQKLGEIYDSDNDKQQAYHFHYEAYRYLPSNLAVLEWLGAYFVTHRVAEKAIPFYEKASLMQPSEPKWPLLVGSCHRRTGNYQQAMKIYKQTHSKFPDSIECLKFLVRLCSDLGLKETTEYAMELKKAEKAKELRERINSSRPGECRVNNQH